MKAKIKSDRGLGRALGVSHGAIADWRKRFQGETPADYNVQKWQKFIEARGLGEIQRAGDMRAMRAAKLREVQLRCEGLSRQLARDDREVVTLAEVDRILGHVSQTLRLVIISELENNLPPRLDGQPAAAMRPLMRDAIDTIFDRMLDCLDKFEVTKGFRQSLEAAAS